MLALDQYALGQTNAELALETREDNHLATLHMVRQSRRGLQIVSHELDPAVYDQPDMAEAIKQMLLDNRRAQIRIIVFEPRLLSQRGHLLLRLSHDLSSFIEIRRVGRQHEHSTEAVFIADDCGYIHRQLYNRYEGTANFNDRRRCKSLLNDFETMWAVATSDSNLRRMSL